MTCCPFLILSAKQRKVDHNAHFADKGIFGRNFLALSTCFRTYCGMYARRQMLG